MRRGDDVFSGIKESGVTSGLSVGKSLHPPGGKLKPVSVTGNLVEIGTVACCIHGLELAGNLYYKISGKET
jgi:hypothetical protein